MRPHPRIRHHPPSLVLENSVRVVRRQTLLALAILVRNLGRLRNLRPVKLLLRKLGLLVNYINLVNLNLLRNQILLAAWLSVHGSLVLTRGLSPHHWMTHLLLRPMTILIVLESKLPTSVSFLAS